METLKSLIAASHSQPDSDKFKKAINDLLANWIIRSGEERYEITEIELFYHVPEVLEDPYLAKNVLEQTFGRWYLRPTGVGMTIGGAHAYGSIQIRGVKRQSDGLYFNGPLRTFEALFQDGGFSGSDQAKTQIVRMNTTNRCKFITVPRVALSITEDSKNLEEKLDFIMRPYRYIRSDTPDFADKYLALLFIKKVLGQQPPFQVETTIYNKYDDHFESGFHAGSLEEVWAINSRLHRMARLMGWLHANKANALLGKAPARGKSTTNPNGLTSVVV